MVKAVAQQRGLEHQKHKHLFPVVNALAKEVRDRELRSLFHTANGLHSNFYEDWLEAEYVADGLDEVERFLAKVERVL